MTMIVRSNSSFFYKLYLSSLYTFTSIQYNNSFSYQYHHSMNNNYNHYKNHPQKNTWVLSSSSQDNGSMDNNPNDNDPVVALGLPSPLILGSSSFTRKLILKEMGISYEILVRPINEKEIGDRLKDTASDLVLKVATAKADHLVQEITNIKKHTSILEHPLDDDRKEGWLVLTADQVITHNGDILEKPESLQEAKDFVQRYALSPPRTVGACVLTHIPSMIQVAGVDTAEIKFKRTVAANNSELIDRLVDDGAPVLKCAGGLMVEHPFVKEHIECIDGTQESVMGLSRDLVIRLLHEIKDKLNGFD